MAPEHGLGTSRGWQHPGGSSGTRCDLETQVPSMLPRLAPRSPTVRAQSQLDGRPEPGDDMPAAAAELPRAFRGCRAWVSTSP